MERTQCAGNCYLFLRLLIVDSGFEHGCAASLVEDSGCGTQMTGADGSEEVNFSFNGAKGSFGRQGREHRHRHSSISQSKDHATVDDLLRVEEAGIDDQADSPAAILGLFNLEI
jgi:hypothetical protein